MTAPDTLAEGEFNRFYIGGLYLRALTDDIVELVVYRAKQVSNPRRESEPLIGTRIPPEKLPQDIRTYPEKELIFLESNGERLRYLLRLSGQLLGVGL